MGTTVAMMTEDDDDGCPLSSIDTRLSTIDIPSMVTFWIFDFRVAADDRCSFDFLFFILVVHSISVLRVPFDFPFSMFGIPCSFFIRSSNFHFNFLGSFKFTFFDFRTGFRFYFAF